MTGNLLQDDKLRRRKSGRGGKLPFGHFSGAEQPSDRAQRGLGAGFEHPSALARSRARNNRNLLRYLKENPTKFSRPDSSIFPIRLENQPISSYMAFRRLTCRSQIRTEERRVGKG